MPVCDKAQLLQISFVEDCLYVLPKCFPIVDFALLSKRCLILIQASVPSLADHQSRQKVSVKTLNDLTNRELFAILQPTGQKILEEKGSLITAIMKVIKSNKLIKGDIELKYNLFIYDNEDIKLEFWKLLWINDELSVGNQLFRNAFGTDPSTDEDRKKVYLIYITASTQVPRERKIDEGNPQVIVAGGSQLSKILSSRYQQIIRELIDTESNTLTFEEKFSTISNLIRHRDVYEHQMMNLQQPTESKIQRTPNRLAIEPPLIIFYARIGKNGEYRDLPALMEPTMTELIAAIRKKFSDVDGINGEFAVMKEGDLPVTEDTTVSALNQDAMLTVVLKQSHN